MLDLLTVSCPPRGPTILKHYKPYIYDKVPSVIFRRRGETALATMLATGLHLSTPRSVAAALPRYV